MTNFSPSESHLYCTNAYCDIRVILLSTCCLLWLFSHHRIGVGGWCPINLPPYRGKIIMKGFNMILNIVGAFRLLVVISHVFHIYYIQIYKYYDILYPGNYMMLLLSKAILQHFLLLKVTTGLSQSSSTFAHFFFS